MIVRALLLAVAVFTPVGLMGQQQSAYETYLRQQGIASGAQDSLASSPVQMLSGPQAAATDEAWSFLKDKAMGVVKGCDYTEYLRLAQQIQSGWDMYEQWNSWSEVKRFAVPFMDMISMFLRAGTTHAARRSAELEGEGVLYQLEQLCNAVKQADEINRSYQLIRAGKLNIDGALDWLGDALDDERRRNRTPGADRRHIQETWAVQFDSAAYFIGGVQDSLWTMVSATLGETLAASEDMHTALDEVYEDLAEVKKALTLTAEREDGQWTCPEGYPDPNSPDVEWMDGFPICGPVGPERATQMLAHIELIKTHLKAIQIAADARGLEVDAVRLMADNYMRRLQHTTDVISDMGY